MRKTQLTDVIHYEKMSQKPNALLIQTLQQTLDGLREFDFKDFIGTGRFIPIDTLPNEYKIFISKDTASIVVYVGNYFIPCDADGYFFITIDNRSEADEQLEVFKSKNLIDVERKLWDTYAHESFKP